MSVGMIWEKMRGFSITVVKDEEGQSIFEFMLMLPVLVGLSMMLVRLNTAIQISIVNQKYARARTLFLAFNSPFYPRLEQKEAMAKQFNNQMVLGVSDNVAPADGGEYTPKATTSLITRNKGATASDGPKEEPNLRSNVRIRNSVTLCSASVFVNTGQSGNQPILPMGGTPLRVVGRSALTESTKFNNYCGSSLKYEQ